VPLVRAYPLIFVLAGYVAATLLYQRAVPLMRADAKAALVDASSSTRLLNVVVIAVFLALVFWRPLLAWVFLGCAYLALGIRSVFRLRRLNLPIPAARLILMGNVSGVAGITLCAFIFALRASH
jgi:hypothetical protein